MTCPATILTFQLTGSLNSLLPWFYVLFDHAEEMSVTSLDLPRFIFLFLPIQVFCKSPSPSSPLFCGNPSGLYARAFILFLGVYSVAAMKMEFKFWKHYRSICHTINTFLSLNHSFFLYKNVSSSALHTLGRLPVIHRFLGRPNVFHHLVYRWSDSAHPILQVVCYRLIYHATVLNATILYSIRRSTNRPWISCP